MKRILLLLLCLVMTLSLLAGCGPAEQPGTDPATETTQTEGFDPAKLKINGVELEKYTIVYAGDGRNSVYRSNSTWIVESGKMADAAQQFRDALYELTGKKLSIVSENESETEYEIILGKAERNAAKNYYKSTNWTIEKYAYGVSEGKLLLAGGSSNACYFAGMAFIEACKAMDSSDFTAEMVKAEAELITVACIGDSITDGAGELDNGASNNRNTHSYPIFLQKLLGFGYYVGNYGYSGKMMIDFSLTENFHQSLEAKPDVVIMMLGTNDCNPSKNPEWGKDSFQKTYKDAADAMLARYRSANKDVQVFIMTPPSIIQGAERQKSLKLIAQYNREFAAENNYTLVDMYKASQQAQWVFNDGIHPQGEVYKELAQVVYDGIKDTIKK